MVQGQKKRMAQRRKVAESRNREVEKDAEGIAERPRIEERGGKRHMAVDRREGEKQMRLRHRSE